MSGAFPTTLTEWMRDMVRRVEALERRRLGSASTSGGGAGGSANVAGWVGRVAFAGTLGSVPLVGAPVGVMASFNGAAGGQRTVAVETIIGANARLRADVPDGSYQIAVIFIY